MPGFTVGPSSDKMIPIELGVAVELVAILASAELRVRVCAPTSTVTPSVGVSTVTGWALRRISCASTDTVTVTLTEVGPLG
jgi:hypothetical protein